MDLKLSDDLAHVHLASGQHWVYATSPNTLRRLTSRTLPLPRPALDEIRRMLEDFDGQCAELARVAPELLSGFDVPYALHFNGAGALVECFAAVGRRWEDIIADIAASASSAAEPAD